MLKERQEALIRDFSPLLPRVGKRPAGHIKNRPHSRYQDRLKILLTLARQIRTPVGVDLIVHDPVLGFCGCIGFVRFAECDQIAADVV